MEIRYLYDDEILLVPNMEDSLWQNRINSKVNQQKTMEEPFVHIRSPFWVLLAYFSRLIKRCDNHRVADGSCEDFSQHPRVFVLHQRGLPFPKIYSEQVPPSTILIAVNPSDYPRHNCFEAQPITLKRLMQESQHDESNHSMHSDASLRDGAQCLQM